MDENTNAAITDSAPDITGGEPEVTPDQTPAPVVQDNTPADEPDLTDPFDGLWADGDDEEANPEADADDAPADDPAPDDNPDAPADPVVDAVPEAPAEDPQPTEDQPIADEPRQPSNVEKRFSKLTNEKRELQAQVDELQQLVAKQKPLTPQTSTAELQEQIQIAARIEAAKATVAANARAVQAEERAVEDEVIHQARIDWMTAVQEHGVLNPKSPDYVPQVASRISQVVNKSLKMNPYQSVAEIIDDHMFVGRATAGAKAQQISTKISQQLANQALPAGSTRSSSSLTLADIESMDIDEFERRKPEVDRFMRSQYKG